MNPGEMVLPGQVAAALADLSHLRVETTDLSERDAARVAVGQSVKPSPGWNSRSQPVCDRRRMQVPPRIQFSVFVDARGVNIAGRVAQIASEATVVAGDTVYAVMIEFDTQPAGLRWGMSAQAQTETK